MGFGLIKSYNIKEIVLQQITICRLTTLTLNASTVNKPLENVTGAVILNLIIRSSTCPEN